MKSICVYCGSCEGNLLQYQMAAIALGKLLAQKEITLVYGGGHVGLMGILADAVLQNNGKVIGVIPKALYEKELAHLEITELLIVENMHERKQKMADLADAFIALPGGLGTLEELLEILTWTKLGFQKKPCAILNVADYYKHLLHFFEFMIEQKFLSRENFNLFVSESPNEVVKKLSEV
ncbi:TIGR00730 family Rossman fold protein [Candidatus Uabimicrobium sp. HlEnr_7]|uniref:LOG family protein n=1 Tax=Candidatus Uabimicrobium helgolandensis TaxID=3095367 RepID=UPI0035586DBF